VSPQAPHVCPTEILLLEGQLHKVKGNILKEIREKRISNCSQDDAGKGHLCRKIYLPEVDNVDVDLCVDSQVENIPTLGLTSYM